jgi:hypothetical protein
MAASMPEELGLNLPGWRIGFYQESGRRFFAHLTRNFLFGRNIFLIF